jgi:hypothetical protein
MVLFRHFSLVFGLVISTATAITRVSDDIRLNMESNQPSTYVLLNFSKTFNRVCHCSFLSCVSATAFMLRRRHLSLLIFLLGVKKLHVSPLAPLVAGVPQGSPISQLCFSLFIDDMTEVLNFRNTACMLTICKFIMKAEENAF